MSEKIVRRTLEQARKLSVMSDVKKIENTTDEEIARQIDEDPDLYHLTAKERAEFKVVGAGPSVFVGKVIIGKNNGKK